MIVSVTRQRIAALLISTAVAGPVGAGGLPVVDIPNLLQNTRAVIDGIAQTKKQIEQYRTQMQQYELEIRNATRPERYIWDDARRTISQLRTAVDTLENYKTQFGDINELLKQFGDLDYYRASSCFQDNGPCTEQEQAALNERSRLGLEVQKRASDALVRGILNQQESIAADADRLLVLQANAEGAEGQLQALGAANQLASAQVNQLLQLRGMMTAQQQLLAVESQRRTDREAREAAASEQLRRSRFKPSAQQEW
jgi:P-type conjugative transfer protein TrbJ